MFSCLRANVMLLVFYFCWLNLSHTFILMCPNGSCHVTSELSVFKLNFVSHFTIYTFYHIVYFTYISLLPSGVLSLFTSGPLYHGQFIYTFNTFRLVLFLSVVRVLIYCLPFSVIVYFCSTTLNHTAIVWPLRFGVLWEYYFPIHIPLSVSIFVIFH